MRKILLFVLFVSATFISKAQDRYFARTYTTNILTKNAVDLEFSHTSRFGHKNQFFHAQDQRMEIEIGVGNSWQTAFYFNRYQERYSDSNDGTVTSNEIGFSNEWKWKVQNQGKHKPAIALYGEWGIKGGDEIELETKLILDKWVGKSLWAFNAVAEYEKEFKWQNGKLESGKWEAPVEFDLAYMYSLKPNLGIGFEIRNHNEISKEGWEHSVFFGGPTLDFRGHNWFVIFNYLPQWINVHKTSVAPFNKVLDEHERVEARILLGISILN
ncbi:MAG TPA: hypothetical protein VKC90_13770 [Chitinophagaceae bacterium]|nr:hypothetical protein [Chitinophagaceae bacterium]